MSNALYNDEYSRLIGQMVYEETGWDTSPCPVLFDLGSIWLDALTTLFYECVLESAGCLDADV